MEKEGFFDDGGTRQVAKEAHEWQTTLLEEARGSSRAATHQGVNFSAGL